MWKCLRSVLNLFTSSENPCYCQCIPEWVSCKMQMDAKLQVSWANFLSLLLCLLFNLCAHCLKTILVYMCLSCETCIPLKFRGRISSDKIFVEEFGGRVTTNFFPVCVFSWPASMCDLRVCLEFCCLPFKFSCPSYGKVLFFYTAFSEPLINQLLLCTQVPIRDFKKCLRVSLLYPLLVFLIIQSNSIDWSYGLCG